MTNKLIFVRHGVRGIKRIGNTPPDCLPYFNMKVNLALFGHIYSYKQGKFIADRYGHPNFIYADVTDERTIATAIAIAKASDQNRIWLHNGNIDPYFKQLMNVTQESLEIADQILEDNEYHLQEMKEEVQKLLPCIQLDSFSTINKNGKTEGLVDQLGAMAQIPTFAILSKIKTPLIKVRNMLEQAYHINYLVKHPTIDSIQPAAENLLNGIFYLLSIHRLSVLVGHDTNIAVISQYLNLPYQADDHAKLYTPPNSGYIFTLESQFIRIEKIYINFDGDFIVKKYIKLPFPQKIINPQFDLISRLV